jgi:hypothetical protein
MPLSKKYKSKARPRGMNKRAHKARRSPMAPFGYKQPIGRTELKFIDTALDGSNGLKNGDGTGTQGVITCNGVTNTVARCLLNGIGQGSDANQRIGRKFMMKKLHGKIQIRINNANSQAQTVRFVIVYDRGTNSASQIPAFTVPFNEDHFYAMVNLDNRDRFIIVWDKIVDIGDRVSGAATGYVPTTSGFPGVGTKHLTFTKRINLETVNSSTGAAIGSIATGGLYLYCISNSAGDNSTGFLCSGVIRLRYADP